MSVDCLATLAATEKYIDIFLVELFPYSVHIAKDLCVCGHVRLLTHALLSRGMSVKSESTCFATWGVNPVKYVCVPSYGSLYCIKRGTRVQYYACAQANSRSTCTYILHTTYSIRPVVWVLRRRFLLCNFSCMANRCAHTLETYLTQAIFFRLLQPFVVWAIITWLAIIKLLQMKPLRLFHNYFLGPIKGNWFRWKRHSLNDCSGM